MDIRGLADNDKINQRDVTGHPIDSCNARHEVVRMQRWLNDAELIFGHVV
jgi:hypothetical protein